MRWLASYSVDIGGARVSLTSLLVALAIVFLGFLLASKLSRRVRGENAVGGPGTHWRAVLAKITSYAIRLITLIFALELAGVNIASVVAASAVVAVGIGLAMQKVAENFVSGVILMAERSIREGDIVEFDGKIARVVYIGIRATIAQTLDDEEIIVPNSVLVQSAVKNLTLTESIYRIRVRVGVSYSADLRVAEEVLAATAEALDWRVMERDPVVLLIDFGPSSVDFEVSVWTSDVWRMRRGQSELRKAIWHALQQARIAIPFPQMDVHVGGVSVVLPEGRGGDPVAPGPSGGAIVQRPDRREEA
jgi:small-conductance mechanosensitive channel